MLPVRLSHRLFVRAQNRALRPALACSLVLGLVLPAACGDEPERSDKGQDEDDASDRDGEGPDDQGSSDEPIDSPSVMRDAGNVRDAGFFPLDTGVRDSGLTPPVRADSGGPRPATDAGPTVVPPANVGDGGSVSGISLEELEQLRQVCVDEINRYRATLMLPAIKRASAAHETCSDQGAMKDGVSKKAHSSAGRGNPCFNTSMPMFPGFGSQNTCPDYPVGSRGAATIADALKGCLKQMWAEGEPPVGEAQCIADYRAGNTACFLAHGHYLNMKNASRGVSCGFFHSGNNKYWMNQDFL
jgi:hypothetical protein